MKRRAVPARRGNSKELLLVPVTQSEKKQYQVHQEGKAVGGSNGNVFDQYPIGHPQTKTCEQYQQHQHGNISRLLLPDDLDQLWQHGHTGTDARNKPKYLYSRGAHASGIGVITCLQYTSPL